MENYKNVIYVASPEVSVNYRWEENYKNLSPEVNIVSIDELNNLPLEQREIFKIDAFEEGMVLMFDKIGNRYVRAEEAEDCFWESRSNAIDKIAVLLGAKSIKRNRESYKCETRELVVSADVGMEAKSMSVEYSDAKIEERTGKYITEKTFQGKYSAQGYEEAKKFCQETGLIKDLEIERMLNYRSPYCNNPILKDKYIVSISSDCEARMDAAFSLNYLESVFKLSAKVSKSIKTKVELQISLEIDYCGIDNN